MTFALLLFYINLLLCGVNVLCESADFFHFKIYNNGTGDWVEEVLSSEYSFQEGVEYRVHCYRPPGWDLHWEVEPYGVRSTTVDGRYSTYMWFTLHRDDKLTIYCSTKSMSDNRVETMGTRFVWNKISKAASSTPPTSFSIDATDGNCNFDADQHTCHTSIISASLQLQDHDNGCECKFDLQIHTRTSHSNRIGIDNNECKGPCYCPNTNGSSSCECQQGYNKNATGWCEDINECQLNVSNCKNSERCWNTMGSFKCCPNYTILDKKGCCVCPDHHVYYQNRGCLYDQCLNTTCGLGAECIMALGKPLCFCPDGTTGNPHEECARQAEPWSPPNSNSFEPTIDISIFVDQTDKRLKYVTTGSDELILDKKFTLSVNARDVNFTKPEKRIICHELDKPTGIHVNQSLASAPATDYKYIAKVPKAVSSMIGTWVCLITGSTVHKLISVTFPVAINNELY